MVRFMFFHDVGGSSPAKLKQFFLIEYSNLLEVESELKWIRSCFVAVESIH